MAHRLSQLLQPPPPHLPTADFFQKHTKKRIKKSGVQRLATGSVERMVVRQLMIFTEFRTFKTC